VLPVFHIFANFLSTIKKINLEIKESIDRFSTAISKEKFAAGFVALHLFSWTLIW